MLSQETIDIVKVTAPVLEQHGETLTRHFYKRMFEQNPEVAPFFNSSNQQGGTQQRALAAAICAYAANIDNLEVLGSAVELIANKHASLQIKPEHYPIVGDNLLASIKEVLGDAATDDIINAWAEAYTFLSNILMGREKEIYESQTRVPGGWLGFKEFKVDRRVAESDNITSFYLKPCNGESVPSFLPGQYITIRLPTPGGSTTMRNYSLSDKPGREHFRISVKREPGLNTSTPEGYASNFLSNQLNVGDILEVGPPCGEFFLDLDAKHQRPLVLLAAGIGITPILSILQAALEAMPERPIFLIHACLTPRVQAFKSTIDHLASDFKNLHVHYRYSDVRPEDLAEMSQASIGFVDAELIESLVGVRDADYYFCGPKPFMVQVYHDLLEWGIPGSQVNFEFFGPREQLQKRPEPAL